MLPGDLTSWRRCVDFSLSTTYVCVLRLHLVSQVAAAVAQFDEYSNDMWIARQAVLTKFQQAARKVMKHFQPTATAAAAAAVLLEKSMCLTASKWNS